MRPDFKGLPKGSGSVAQGMDLWEAKCASCHGVFGESNEVFSPLIGGTTKDDVKSGRVARLTDPGYPGRTTLMKVATVSTLWDYIYRAMPWNAPKSLKPDEVYALTAYMLNLGGVVSDDYKLSDRNIAELQQQMPNRLGMSTDHGLWPGKSMGNGGKPDVKATACMNNCATEAKVASYLPEHARDAHGNLAEQNRLVGAQRGIDTSRTQGARPHRRRHPQPMPNCRRWHASSTAWPATASTTRSSVRGCARCRRSTPPARTRPTTWHRRSWPVAAASGALCRCRHNPCPRPTQKRWHSGLPKGPSPDPGLPRLVQVAPPIIIA